MTVTKDQAQMLATLAAAARPHGARRWDTAGTMAAIAKVADRNLADVILATIRAAADRDCESPGVIPTNGPHWREQLKPQPFTPEARRGEVRCTVCGRYDAPGHLDDHPFSKPREKLAPDAIHGAVAALRDAIEPTGEAKHVRTLDELAADKPAMRAKVDRLRATLPASPLREPEAAAPTSSEVGT